MVSPVRRDEFDKIVFETDVVRVGAFRAHPDHPSFQDSGPARNFCFVFPRTAVQIQHEHERAFVANPNVVTFYNRHQAYQRSTISESGDQCDWFGVDGSVVRDIVRRFDPSVDDRPEKPFRLARTFTDAPTYLWQRRLFQRVMTLAPADKLAVEEQVVLLLERVLESAYEWRERPQSSRPRRDAIHHVEVLLSDGAGNNLGLPELAARAELSVYHLCRTFRAATGRTLHQYRNQFRVRTSLEKICERPGRLVDLAVELGFSSHSHFTNLFRREFGHTPSAARNFVSRATS